MDNLLDQAWAMPWFQWTLDVTMRGTLLLVAVMSVVLVTRRWTVPAWRFSAYLTATLGIAFVAISSIAGWEWRILPATWSSTGLSQLSDNPIGQAWPTVLFAVWAVGASALFLRLILGQLSLWRLSFATPVEASELWRERLQSLSSQIGLRRDVRLYISSERTVPMTWGVIRNNLLIPKSMVDWPTDQLDAVILHEFAHIRRADCFWQWWIQCIACVLWFNPLVWLAKRRMLDERENACDSIAIASGAVPSAYAEALIAVSKRRTSQRLVRGSTLLAVAMAGGSALYRRIELILERPPKASRVSMTWRVALGAGAALAALAHPRTLPEFVVKEPVVAAPPAEPKQANGPKDAAALASGSVRFDPLLRAFVPDDAPKTSKAPSNPKVAAEPEPTNKTLDHLETMPIVTLNDAVQQEVWDALARSGKLERLELDAVDDASLLGFQAPPTVTQLNLANVVVDDWDRLSCLPLLTQLSISDTELSPSAFRGISSFSSLEQLRVEKSQIRNCGVSALHRLENLRTLSLAGSEVDDCSLAVLARLPHLRQLSLADMKISCDALHEIARSVSIEDLDLTGADVDQQALVALSTMVNLKTVHVSCLDVPMLRILLDAPRLQTIEVRNAAGQTEGMSPAQWRERLGKRECPPCLDVDSPTIT